MIEQYDARAVVYRGMRSVRYPLIPKTGRLVPPDSVKSRDWNETEILRLFKEQSLPGLDFMPTNDGDWLALGHQYGLPTRLCRRVGKFIPRHWARRITTRGGLFTSQPDAYEPCKSEDMERIVISNDIRGTLKKTLNKYDVDWFLLFSSLDSLATHIEWLPSKGY